MNASQSTESSHLLCRRRAPAPQQRRATERAAREREQFLARARQRPKMLRAPCRSAGTNRLTPRTMSTDPTRPAIVLRRTCATWSENANTRGARTNHDAHQATDRLQAADNAMARAQGAALSAEEELRKLTRRHG